MRETTTLNKNKGLTKIEKHMKAGAEAVGHFWEFQNYCGKMENHKTAFFQITCQTSSAAAAAAAAKLLQSPAAHQAPPSLGFSRQEHWSGLPFPSPMHESEAAQSCPTLSDPMDCSLPSSSHGIFQARVLEWGAVANLFYIPIKTKMKPQAVTHGKKLTSLIGQHFIKVVWSLIVCGETCSTTRKIQVCV